MDIIAALFALALIIGLGKISTSIHSKFSSNKRPQPSTQKLPIPPDSKALILPKKLEDDIEKNAKRNKIKFAFSLVFLVSVLGFGIYGTYSAVSYVASIPDRVSAAIERSKRKGNKRICMHGEWLDKDSNTRCATKAEGRLRKELLDMYLDQ
ncbi:hypothetical protein [Ruegeria faecimaris]|uniref:hypothetical protein n=1 Tax=Ruegeria faecimaris TaxID=686389 RepID=UPI00232FAC00|nr:hypothetical protein [Ruegeria faecimaris]